jgi:hypothetical protein
MRCLSSIGPAVNASHTSFLSFLQSMLVLATMELAAHDMHAYTPMGCTPTRCTPTRYTPMRGMPMRCTPMRYMPVREARRERHSHKRYAPARDACPRDACLREIDSSRAKLTPHTWLGLQIFAQAECLPIYLRRLPVIVLIPQHCCQVVYARQCGRMLFAQHRHIQPKLFRSEHGIKFVSGPLIRTPKGIRVSAG